MQPYLATAILPPRATPALTRSSVVVCAVVDEDEGDGDVSAGRVAVEGRDAVSEVRRGVLVEDVLGERGIEDDVP